MLIELENVLTSEQVQQMRALLDASDWVDGKATAGEQSGEVKYNQQIAADSPLGRQLGEAILTALSEHADFLSAALPSKIFPPLFNRYQNGEAFGAHIDNAIRRVPGTAVRVRTDLSATLFLSQPDEYDGGELIIEGQYGAQIVKLAAGNMILYPSTSLHQVTAVTRGARVSSFFWMQSMIRDNQQRELLYDLDQSVQTLAAERGANDGEVLRLTGVYHNLVRQWAEGT